MKEKKKQKGASQIEEQIDLEYPLRKKEKEDTRVIEYGERAPGISLKANAVITVRCNFDEGRQSNHD